MDTVTEAIRAGTVTEATRMDTVTEVSKVDTVTETGGAMMEEAKAVSAVKEVCMTEF